MVRRPRLPELRPWVSAVWWCHGAAAAESVLPAGRAHLVLRPEAGWAAGVLHGPASRPRLAGPAAGEPVIGVVFRPGGLRPFVTAPAGGLADLSVPLPELESGDGIRLAGRVTGGRGPGGAPAGPGLLLHRLERALAAQADRTSAGAGQLIGPAHLISTVRRGLGQGHSVAAVATRLAADRRTLSTLFRREVGFGLKRYARLARFERALRAVRAGDAPSLGLVAAQAGFADQAHLTREFRYFAGFPPGCLHRVLGPAPWHVVHDETFKTGRPEPGTLPP
jgi:AraC-like DNA-binding protein